MLLSASRPWAPWLLWPIWRKMVSLEIWISSRLSIAGFWFILQENWKEFRYCRLLIIKAWRIINYETLIVRVQILVTFPLPFWLGSSISDVKILDGKQKFLKFDVKILRYFSCYNFWIGKLIHGSSTMQLISPNSLIR